MRRHPSPAHASPSRPPRRPPFLRAAVRRAGDDRHVGPALAGAEPAGADQAVVLTAAVPDRPAGDSGAADLPRRAEGAVVVEGARIVSALVMHPGPDRGLPDRGGRGDSRVHPGSRACPHRRLRRELARLDLRRVDRRGRRRALARRAVLGGRVRGTRLGWGHSSVDSAVAYAQAVGARRLVLFHHDPQHADRLLELLQAQAEELIGERGEPPVLAREGMVSSCASVLDAIDSASSTGASPIRETSRDRGTSGDSRRLACSLRSRLPVGSSPCGDDAAAVDRAAELDRLDRRAGVGGMHHPSTAEEEADMPVAREDEHVSGLEMGRPDAPADLGQRVRVVRDIDSSSPYAQPTGRSRRSRCWARFPPSGTARRRHGARFWLRVLPGCASAASRCRLGRGALSGEDTACVAGAVVGA